MDISGNVALVTGGGVRIGRAICEGLAAAGAHLVVHYRTSRAEAEELCAHLSASHGVRAVSLQADLVSGSACTDLVQAARTKMGGLHLLVNSAAVFHKSRLAEVTEDHLLREFWPNLFAPMLLMRAFSAGQEAAGIVNLLDRRITEHDPSCLPYLLTKQALAELTRSAALDLAPRVRVNGVAPGAVLPPPGEDEGYLAEQAGPIPMHRTCSPEEVADAVVYLLRQDAITGQVIYVDGGQHLLGSVRYE